MKLAETVTFGGSALDRAAEWQGRPDALAAAEADPAVRTILSWRGKLLVHEAGLRTLVRLQPDHPVLWIDGALSEPLLLVREEGTAVFASDISGWDPATGDLSQLNAFLDPTLQQHPDLPDGTVFA